MNNKKYITFIAFSAALGGLLFGYDTAVISGAIGNLTEYFHLTPIETGWAISSALVPSSMLVPSENSLII